MARRTLVVAAAATLAAGLLAGCNRTEDKPITDPGFSTATPVPVNSAPMTVPVLEHMDDGKRG